MKRIGLTGGVGMGKSTTARLWAERGWPVIDTDELAREVVAPGEPALAEVVRVLGRDVLTPEGTLNRAVVARLVFADAARRRQLEAILHPPIRERWQARLETYAAEGRPGALVVIPLLFETGAEEAFDRVVCTACGGFTQRGRLRARGWSETETEQRIAAQWPAEEKMRRSHYVVWTEGSMELHGAQVERVLQKVG